MAIRIISFSKNKEEFEIGHFENIKRVSKNCPIYISNSRKIELLTYTTSSQRFFTLDNLNLNIETAFDLKGSLYYYLMALNLYVMWHFLPSEYKDKGFPTINERFYCLKAGLKEEKDCISVTFLTSKESPYLNHLPCACRRGKEGKVVFANGKRLWCETI